MADFRGGLSLWRTGVLARLFSAQRDERGRPSSIGVALVYNLSFRLKLWSDKKMIRFLQTPGPIKKIVLGGLLTVICAAMAITLIPGGLGSDVIGTGTPGQ